MKQRFSYLDLRIITNEVAQELQNCYLQNIYSLESSSRHFMLKFDAGVGKTGKTFLLVDPGMRYHLTKFQHEPTSMPSFFVQKLRKYLKNRRATNFWTAPASRLMVITFTEGQYYLVFEFFAGGNLILLDSNHKILTLFRTVRNIGPDNQNYQLGEQYPIKMDIDDNHNLQQTPSREDIKQWILRDKLGKALYSKISDPSSSLLEYCLRLKNLDPKAKISAEEVDSKLDQVCEAIDLSLEKTKELVVSRDPVPGYILYENDQSTEFEPFKEYFELVHPDSKCEHFASYNATVDNYFGAILSDKAVNKVEQLYALAESRLEAAKNEKQNRIKGLEDMQAKNQEMGDILQENAEAVDAAISAVKALVDQGVDWGDADNLIKLEQEKGNSVAQIIKKLELQRQQVVLRLNDMDITVQLGKSAFANAREYFEIRRIAGTKIEKTAQHATKALRSAEVKIKKDLELNLEKQKQQGAASKLHAIRQPHWFEKFWWFLTSNMFLVVAARDDVQKNTLLRRYFSDKDLLLSSDAPDATLLIIKNPDGQEVPPQTLLQAAAFCVATSVKTWEAKSKAPAWFLNRKQVPRVSNNGDPVSVNDLHFINPKTLVPPTQTDMGMAILWQCEDVDSNVSGNTEGVTKEDPADDSDNEDFPDTQFNSDEDFPDTQFGSDSENSENDDSELGGSDVPDDSDQPQDSEEPETTPEATPETDASLEPAPSETTATVPTDRTPQDFESDPESKSESESESDAESETGSTRETDSRSQSPAIKKARGSKKKLRKYLAQDEDDRRAAMERLGTLKGLQRKAAEQEAKEAARKQELDMRQRRKDRARKSDLDHIVDAPAEDTPFPKDLLFQYKDDEPIIAAVAMFGPWTALQKAQYKAKLVFGPMKKGKASSELLRVLLKTGTSTASEREQQLVAGIRAIDVQQSIAVSRVQVSVTGSAKGGNSKGGNSKGGAKGGSSKAKGNSKAGKKKK